jgi:DNA-binding XRE family transcriptional regulator
MRLPKRQIDFHYKSNICDLVSGHMKPEQQPSLGVTPGAPSNAHLGHGVRRLRLARRLSIEALAGAAQMHPTYLSAIERGLRNPTWTKLCHLAEALDITISALARVAEAEAYGAAYTPLGTPGLSKEPAAAPTSPWRR